MRRKIGKLTEWEHEQVLSFLKRQVQDLNSAVCDRDRITSDFGHNPFNEIQLQQNSSFLKALSNNINTAVKKITE